MFANRVTRTIEVNDDAGGTTPVVIRKLSARILAKASDAQTIEQMKSARTIGTDMIKAFRDTAVDEVKKEAKKDPTPEEKRKALLGSYDRETVLNAGIVSWAVEEPVTPDAIGDLDEETAQALFVAIMDLSIPPESTIPKA